MNNYIILIMSHSVLCYNIFIAGASADDRLLMKAKMNFLATSVPPHDNIVAMVGAVASGIKQKTIFSPKFSTTFFLLILFLAELFVNVRIGVKLI